MGISGAGRRILLLGLALSGAACASDSGRCDLASDARVAIRAIEQNHVDQVLAGDLEAIVPSYAPNAVLMPPNQREVRGREAIRASVTGLPPVTRYELSFDTIEGCGDLAVVKGGYLLEARVQDSPDPVEDSGRFLHVFRREAGEWLIAYDIFSSDRPPP